MAIHTSQIYAWYHSLLRHIASYDAISYDSNYLFGSNGVSLYQVARSAIVLKDWKAAHDEAWNTEDSLDWHDKEKKLLACGNTLVCLAPKLSSLYAIVGDAVQSHKVGDDTVFRSTQASKSWVLERLSGYSVEFFGATFNSQRIKNALECPFLARAATLHLSLLNNGCLRLTTPMKPKAYAFIMCMHVPEKRDES